MELTEGKSHILKIWFSLTFIYVLFLFIAVFSARVNQSVNVDETKKYYKLSKLKVDEAGRRFSVDND